LMTVLLLLLQSLPLFVNDSNAIALVEVPGYKPYVDLFPRTDKSCWTVPANRKHPLNPLLTYSRERTKRKIQTRHRGEPIVPRGDGGIDVKG